MANKFTDAVKQLKQAVLEAIAEYTRTTILVNAGLGDER